MRSLASRTSRTFAALLTVLLLLPCTRLSGQTKASWRAATSAELEAALPDRALVGKERIETEMRTASGIVDGRGHMIAAVVLITAGYAADGKYSHYLLAQAPITLAEQTLPAGTYVVGWTRREDGLSVHIFDAASGNERATVIATPNTASRRVESFRIWPPGERTFIQIGRYALNYRVEP